MPSDIPVSVKTSKVSKLLSFPTPSPLPQEAHAPQRNSRVFRSSVRKSQPVQNQVKEMGNLVSIAEHWFLVKEAKTKALGYFQRQQYGEKTTVHASENGCLEGMSVEEYKRLVDGEFVSDQASTDVCLTELIKSDNLRSMVDYPLHKNLVREVAWPRRLPVYRESYESSKKWDPNLSILKLEAELAQKKIAAFKFMGCIDEAEEVVPSEPFTPLTDEEDDCVNHALCGSNRRELLVVHENSNIDITREVIQCLKPRAWLNDEVINLYLELLKEREERDPKRFLKCHFFNTFFYKKLMGGKNGYDFKGVRRWTTHKKIGYSLINCDKIFVPIHKEMHWCLVVINVKEEKLQYLDSLKGMDTQALKVLARYFADEVKDKSENDINVSTWKHEFVVDLPKQKNGWDCGMFMIKYADFYSRGLKLCFSQEHMPYFRKRTVKEILRLRAE